MTPYWTIFALWALGAVQYARKATADGKILPFALAAAVTALFVGLRNQVGGDWLPYLDIYDNIYFQPLDEALGLSDPGYAFLNWLAAQLDWGVWFPNLVCAIIFTAGLTRLASFQPNPWLAVMVAVPYLVIVVAMGYTRQAAAIGIVCFAVADASERKTWRLVGLIAFAALFHKTAILMLPIMLVPIATRNLLVGLLGVIAFGLFFSFFLGAMTDRLVTNYVQSGYDSQGAAIRVGMNVVAGVLFLLLRDRMGLPDFIKSFWTINAVLSLVSAAALLVLPSSSGVDRIALFLIPLQVVTFSRLPYALSATSRPLPSLTLAVIAYSFAVQFVWLNYADNANSWLPYGATFWIAEEG